MKNNCNFARITLLTILLIVMTSIPLSAQPSNTEHAAYTAPDGFKVVSYSANWNDVSKLKTVYDELRRNTHGEEFKLLRRINIYGGADPNGSGAAGRWVGQWQIVNGVPQLAGNRYIEIYNGSRMDHVKDMARTLSHEYGHHFTYYYYFKHEKRSWDEWRSTGLAQARGLGSNPKVKPKAAEHKWLIQEIAAEDYVQIFGSPTLKTSRDFADIEERTLTNTSAVSYSTDIYNYHPQENYELPLAGNLPGLKQYWLKASGISDTRDGAPSQVTLQLTEVKNLNRVKTPQYNFSWSKSSDDKTAKLEYTLVWFTKSDSNRLNIHPVKTVTDPEPLKAVFGSASGSNMFMWENIPNETAYFVVYIKDPDGNITSSQVLAVDFTKPEAPDTILINDSSLNSGAWFPPRIKVNSEQLYPDVPPVIKNGRTLVPLRGIFEKLGATIEWDGNTRTVTVIKNDIKLTLQIGNTIALVNNREITLDVAPEIERGRTLIPIRFISESIGAEVDWNPDLRLVKVTALP